MPGHSSCIVTMVKNEDFFYEKWIEYYSNFFEKKSIYIIDNNSSDDFRQIIDPKLSIINLPDSYRSGGGFPENKELKDNFDGRRALFVSNLTNGLLNYFSNVIYTDIDELLVPNPKIYSDLSGYLNAKGGMSTVAPLGVRYCHVPWLETATLEKGDKITENRRFVSCQFEYSKPLLKRKRFRWGGGFHACTNKFTIDPDLFLFHIKTCDIEHRAINHSRRNTEFRRFGKGENTLWKESADNVRKRYLENISGAKITHKEIDFEYQAKHMKVNRTKSGFYYAEAPPKEVRDGSIYLIPEQFVGIF